MDKFSIESLAIVVGLIASAIGFYVRLELNAVREKHEALANQVKEIKSDQKERGEWIEKKIDLFMEKFETMNDKINEFIHEFSKK